MHLTDHSSEHIISNIQVVVTLAGVAEWAEHSLGTKAQFPVRAHAWVAGQVPSGDDLRGNHTLMFLSLSFSLPYPL